MKKITAAFLLISSLFASGQKFGFTYSKDFKIILDKTNDPSDKLQYEKLLTRFQRNDTTLTDYEVLALLIGFTDSKNFRPYSYLTTERKIYSLNGNGEFKKALIMADSFLAFVPVSQQAIIEKSYSFHKLSMPDSAKHYMWQFRRIMAAMGQSGDGLTPETAFFSLGPADGQNFIRKFLASGIGMMGSGRDKDGNFVDILEMVWKDKETGEESRTKLYFQIQHATKTMFADLDLEDSGDKSDTPKKKKK